MTPAQMTQSTIPARATRSPGRGYILDAILFSLGASLLVATYGTILPLIFPLVLALPVLGYLLFRQGRRQDEVRIFIRSFTTGLVAAGIASYYAIVLLDPYQLASDAWSFYELSSQAGPPRSLQDLQTITEGAGAVVLWSWFYDAAALLGFPREPYVGVSVNIVIIAIAAVVCARSARALYGEDPYRTDRLILFFTISGNMWLFAGLHMRDSSIFLVVVVLTHFWISFLAQLKHSKVIWAVAATLVAMPVLEVLRKEFFYVPLMIGFTALVALNFSRGRGDTRFITLVSIVVGLLLAVAGLVAFGDEIQTLFLTGQQTYSEGAIAESRSGSLGTALIVEQSLLIRLALGLPYLLYFPIPFWAGLGAEGAIQLFKSINAVSFYFISAFLFAGAFLILTNRALRSPGFLFVLIVPFAFSASIVLTSLESRHLGAFMSLFFLVGLMPDLRLVPQRKLVRFCLILICLSMFLVHAAWFAARYG